MRMMALGGALAQFLATIGVLCFLAALLNLATMMELFARVLNYGLFRGQSVLEGERREFFAAGIVFLVAAVVLSCTVNFENVGGNFPKHSTMRKLTGHNATNRILTIYWWLLGPAPALS